MNTSNKTSFVSQMPMRAARVRLLSSIALVSYPLGVLVLLNKSGSPLGYGFLAISIVCFALMVGTGVLRLALDTANGLDDLELEIRRRAYAAAYHILSALMLVAITYLAIASTTTWWVPTSGDHWHGVLWGMLLLVFLLPAATMAWSLPREDVGPDDYD